MLLGKGVLKICSKFTGENPCRSVISISLTSAWVSCKFAAYFQNTFFREHLWVAASAYHSLSKCIMSQKIVQYNINAHLTLSWRRPLSYRNQSTDLRSKSMDWFLNDNGLRHERVKYLVERVVLYNFISPTLKLSWSIETDVFLKTMKLWMKLVTSTINQKVLIF